MPKLAATLASLLLIASSIGVNIARYPQVGRMLQAADRPAVVDAANSAQAAKPLATDMAGSDLPPAKSLDDSTDTGTAHPAALANEEPSTRPATQIPAGTNVLVSVATVPIVDVQPMMLPAGPVDTGKRTPASGNEVQRLPPVETSGFTSADADSDAVCYGAAYPATSTP